MSKAPLEIHEGKTKLTNAEEVPATNKRFFFSLNNVGKVIILSYGVFSHDVTAAMLVSQNNETAAMLVSQTNPVGVVLFSYANDFFCSNKFA